MNNTTVDALKDVYTELGGSAATVASMQTDAEVIEALSALVGSTIELPAVTSEDNGDVLTVVEGAWAKAEPATPTSELPTVTSEDNGDVLTVVEGAWAKATPNAKITIDCTKSGSSYNLPNNLQEKDICELVASGKEVELKAIIDSNNYRILRFVDVDSTNNFTFMGNYVFSSNVYAEYATLNLIGVRTSISITVKALSTS